MKELSADAKNPHLYTIATLTGHACLAVGNHSIGKKIYKKYVNLLQITI